MTVRILGQAARSGLSFYNFNNFYMYPANSTTSLALFPPLVVDLSKTQELTCRSPEAALDKQIRAGTRMPGHLCSRARALTLGAKGNGFLST